VATRVSAWRTSAILIYALLGACATPPMSNNAPTALPAPVPTGALTPIALANPGFETSRAGATERAEGWSYTQHGGQTGYAFTLDRETKRSGTGSMRIENIQPQVYGSVTQRIDAAPHLGRSVHFSVWLRTDGVVANVYGKGVTPLLQAWAGGSPAVSASFEVAAIAGTTEWIRREVVIVVPLYAEYIEVGVTLSGSGTVWADDAVLEYASR
jgi:hypothetical protein